MHDDTPGIAVGPEFAIAIGAPRGPVELGVVFRREHRIGRDGRCSRVPGTPAPVVGQQYAEAIAFPELVRPKPLVCETDLSSFRDATDVVVQGEAQTYGGGTETTVEVHAPGGWKRAIRVVGDRRCALRSGRVEFTEPEPFESMPVRADRAFGGFDAEGFAVHGDPIHRVLAETNPELGIGGATPFHYPRNPSGIGFHVGRDLERLDGARVPNLEHAFDAVTPERLLCGTPEDWPAAPLPATFDWTDEPCFPRFAYFGYVQDATAVEDALEFEQGWVSREALATPPLHEGGFDERCFRAAAPGMSFTDWRPGAHLGLVNLFPTARAVDVTTPRDVPKVKVTAPDGKRVRCQVHLAALIVRPSEDTLIEVWSARGPAGRRRSPDELARFGVEVR